MSTTTTTPNNNSSNKSTPLFQTPLFKKVIGPIVRGAFKQVPIFGTPIAEGVSNAMGEKGEPKKHSVVSQVTQWIIAAAVTYSLVTKQISLDEFIQKIIQYVSFGLIG